MALPRVEFGGEPPGRPAEQGRHSPADRLRAVLPLTPARPDSGAPEQHVLERDGVLVGDRVVQLGGDLGVLGAQALLAVRHLAREIREPRRASRAVRHSARRPRVRSTWSPTCSARLRKHVSLVPVTDRNRPPPSTTTLCLRDTSEARARSSNDSGRTPAYVYTTSERRS